jgi:hypothetical protein
MPYVWLTARRSRRWTKRIVIRTLRVLDGNGVPLRASALQDHMDGEPDQLLAAASKCFGSWDKAIRAAGIERRRARPRRAVA